MTSRWFISGWILFCSLSPAYAGFDEAVAAANDGQFAVAFKEFSALAEQGDARAQQALAWMYYEGQGRAKDYEKAAHWYARAAEQGNVTAQINLAQMFAYGKGVKQDFTIAARWWGKLAEQGDSKAQSALAGLYYQGKGVKRDLSKAFGFWQQSAQQGIVEAQRNLGLLYGKGQGVEQDDVLAFVWLNAALDQGDQVAAKSRDYAKSQLSEAQIQKAEAQARDYISRYVDPFREKNKSPH
jgi:TPR repeat protein